MRAFVIAAMALLLAHEAAAQDVLRGSSVIEPGPPAMRWGGFYGGGQIGYASAHMDFKEATDSLVSYSLRNSALGGTDVSTWDILGTEDKSATAFGGFIGFNSQWDDLILSLELNYNRTSLSANSAGSLSRGVTASDNELYHTTSSGTGYMNITDYGTVRLRAGMLYGNMLPYVMGGLAVGRAKVSRTSTVEGTIEDDPNPDIPFGPYTGSESRTAYLLGYSFGAGVEMAVLPNVFVRTEYEYVKLTPFSGMSAHINTVRVGAGIKF